MKQVELKTPEASSKMMGEQEKFTELIQNLGDINIVIDSSGFILQINKAADSSLPNLNNWANKHINNFLTIESKEKFDAQLTSLSDISRIVTKSFELNHISNETGEFPVRYKGFKLNGTDNLLLVGNDLTPVAEIQKKFVNSQLALEREYTKYRSYETKYKVLVDFTTDPIILVDGFKGLIVDANPSGHQMFCLKKGKLIGQQLEKLVYWNRTDKILEVLKADALTNSTRVLPLKVNKNSVKVRIVPAVFRAENELCLMLKLTPIKESISPTGEFSELLKKYYENTRDSIVFTDKSGIIKYINNSFLSLCNSGSDQLVLGRSFSDFLGRGIIDLKVLIDTALANGTTVPFTTQFVSTYDIKINVEITATKAFNEYGTFVCFQIRYGSSSRKKDANEIVVSEQATEKIMKLVGSAPLKELVADTNDIVEKICIETALKMTKNNRVATAEMLNLSRQSLYVKLRKYSLL